MNVSGTGKGPISYQWFVGTRGNTSTPIDGATGASYTTPAMTETTNYWVRLSDGTATADSNTALIAVAPADAPGSPPPAGTAPSITTQPQSQTITSGQTATLTVDADRYRAHGLHLVHGSGRRDVVAGPRCDIEDLHDARTRLDDQLLGTGDECGGIGRFSDCDDHRHGSAARGHRAIDHEAAPEPDDQLGTDLQLVRRR